jgi:opacity protein-like surface antigen
MLCVATSSLEAQRNRGGRGQRGRSVEQEANPFSFTVFAGAAIPVGDAADNLNTGYTLGVAGDYRPDPMSPLGFRLEASYSDLGAKGLSNTGVDAKETDAGANLNIVLWAPTTSQSTVAPYITGGVNLDRLEGRVSVGNTTTTQSDNHFGFNIGGGLDLPLSGFAVRLDARFKQISTSGSNFRTVPITVGIRF